MQEGVVCYPGVQLLLHQLNGTARVTSAVQHSTGHISTAQRSTTQHSTNARGGRHPGAQLLLHQLRGTAQRRAHQPHGTAQRNAAQHESSQMQGGCQTRVTPCHPGGPSCSNVGNIRLTGMGCCQYWSHDDHSNTRGAQWLHSTNAVSSAGPCKWRPSHSPTPLPTEWGRLHGTNPHPGRGGAPSLLLTSSSTGCTSPQPGQPQCTDQVKQHGASAALNLIHPGVQLRLPPAAQQLPGQASRCWPTWRPRCAWSLGYQPRAVAMTVPCPQPSASTPG
jgi:hypothetical protein